MGWAQEPQTLNPFIDQDEEDFVVWAINWRLLVDFGTKDLGPVPGIAEKLGGLARQEDRHLQPVRGPEVVRRPADHVEGRQVQLRDVRAQQPAVRQLRRRRRVDRHAGPAHGRAAPQAAGRPHRRRPVRLHPARARLGQGIGQAAHRLAPAEAAARRQRALRGHRVPARPDHTMERNPDCRGPKGKFDEIQLIKYGNADAVERALSWARSTSIREVAPSSFARLGKQKNIKTSQAPSPSFTQLAFNLCTQAELPGREVQPRRAGPRRAPGDRATRSTASGSTRSRPAARPSSATACCRLLQDLLRAAGGRLPARRRQGQPDARRRRLRRAATASADEGRREALVRPRGALGVPVNIQAARLVAEMAKQIGVEFKVQVMSVDKLTEITTRKKRGKPAPDFDTFVWGWGGDPVRPEPAARACSPRTRSAGSSDSFYSNPEYDRLYDEAGGRVRHRRSARRSSSR